MIHLNKILTSIRKRSTDLTRRNLPKLRQNYTLPNRYIPLRKIIPRRIYELK